MANLMDYLDWRGDLTLEISPFNEVDALILAELSFVDFDGIVPPPELGRGLPLNEAAEAFFARHGGRDVAMGVLVPDTISKMLRKLMTSPRFRNMILNGDKLIIPTYFADILNIMDINTNEVTSVELNPEREETAENKGERYFNDASHCFQNWQSCNGCHPGDGRTDGMNWDLMNDGVGNSKNCKSMLFSHVTPPNMISGIREHAERAVRAGFNFIQFFEVSEEDAACVDAYLKSLRPVPSPYLVNGELSDLAKEGQKVFEKLKCGECHSGVYYTDMKYHRIGEDIEFEKGWDTPTLREVWRTAPYLFDGRAATMEEVFTVHKHGIEKKISAKEAEELAEYVNSL